MFLVVFVCINLIICTALSGNSELPLDTLIASTFLKGRKAFYENAPLHDKIYEFFLRTPLSERIFGTKNSPADVTLHDMYMVIKKEVSETTELVIIQTFVLGSPEDFTGETILNHEQQHLKFILIKRYLAKLQELGSGKKISVVLSDRTKSISAPEYCTYETSPIIGIREVNKNLKWMRFLTVFTEEEFGALIKKYFGK